MDDPEAGHGGSRSCKGPEHQSSGLSLDRLAKAFAAMLGSPRPSTADPQSDVIDGGQRPDDPVPIEVDASPDLDQESQSDGSCRIDPETILEAMLFVGMPDGSPLPSSRVASLVRGMREAEVDALAMNLSARYTAQNRPYEVVRRGSGWLVRLRAEFERFESLVEEKTRSVRLDAASLDVLATVAWNQPIGREALIELGCDARPSTLAQLVRRGLLMVSKDATRTPCYSTTQRFLDVFKLESLDDLPRPGEAP